MGEGTHKGSDQNPLEVIAAKLYAGALSNIPDELGDREQVVGPTCGIRPLDSGSVVVVRARTLLNGLNPRMDEPCELAIEALDQSHPVDVLVASSRVPNPTGPFGKLSTTCAHSRQCRCDRGWLYW